MYATRSVLKAPARLAGYFESDMAFRPSATGSKKVDFEEARPRKTGDNSSRGDIQGLRACDKCSSLKRPKLSRRRNIYAGRTWGQSFENRPDLCDSARPRPSGRILSRQAWNEVSVHCATDGLL